ncbi:MAG: hypothetical protein F6K03_04220 [Kamptonema sp. SIO4C4]|nr:hypothetical protein [Kamptonema sp. SIO4C4]
MAIIALRAWYLEQYEPIREIIKRPHDLRLSRNSLLKSGLRADFLDDMRMVENSDWFGRYLEGETVEFYIEGSGGYAISNIDLISQEIYFTKRETSAFIEPQIFFSYQQEYPTSSEIIGDTLESAIATLNQRSRLPLHLEKASRPQDTPLRLSSNQFRQIRRSLLVVADGTAIAQTPGENTPHLLLSPHVCLELGYALNNKRPGEILLLQMEHFHKGQLPFDLSSQQKLPFTTPQDLQKTLPTLLETLLQRFSLFS